MDFSKVQNERSLRDPNPRPRVYEPGDVSKLALIQIDRLRCWTSIFCRQTAAEAVRPRFRRCKKSWTSSDCRRPLLRHFRTIDRRPSYRWTHELCTTNCRTSTSCERI
ncbi:unnamed protein product [Heligmosomoides polygyrus]|uniref:Uncharacterized protein n=1 Tax=Heligmosomoides polygyrus TaxID=6339 RepID=A0A183G494_HELPZ|nr:unnamed protein product [Heligmosomoides polygyrus]